MFSSCRLIMILPFKNSNASPKVEQRPAAWQRQEKIRKLPNLRLDVNTDLVINWFFCVDFITFSSFRPLHLAISPSRCPPTLIWDFYRYKSKLDPQSHPNLNTGYRLFQRQGRPRVRTRFVEGRSIDKLAIMEAGKLREKFKTSTLSASALALTPQNSSLCFQHLRQKCSLPLTHGQGSWQR